VIAGRTSLSRVALVVALVCSLSVGAAEPDWSGYAGVLQRHAQVSPGGVWVDYVALHKDADFDRVVRQIAAYPVATLATPAERTAFYINTYNVLAMKVVSDNWPVASIKDAGSFLSPVWGKPAGVVGGKTMSLDNVENQYLRKLGDPRVHFAIVCASRSCPDLRLEPYAAARLDAQLDDQAHRFLSDAKKGLRIEPRIVRTSRIFDWFEEDFSGSGVESFLRRYRTDIPRQVEIVANLPYDWSLNGRPKAAQEGEPQL